MTTTTKFVAVVASIKDKDAVRPGPNLDALWLTACGEYVKKYWADMSGGRELITWAVHPPVELAIPVSPKPDSVATIVLVRQKAAADGVPFEEDEHLVVFKDWVDGGTGQTGSGSDPTVVAENFSVNIVLHEMGHFFQDRHYGDTGHAGKFSNFTNLDYEDKSCLMGGGDWAVDARRAFPAGPVLVNPKGSQKGKTYTIAGPGMSPPMTVRAGWLDPANTGVVKDVTGALPANVTLAPWTGSPPPNHQGSHVAVVARGLAPDGDPVWIALRSPSSPWDKGFPTPEGGKQGDAFLIATEAAPRGATYLLASCPAKVGSWMRLGRAPLRVQAEDGTGPGEARISITLDPWRGWTQMSSPDLDWASQLAAVSREGGIDLFVIGASGTVHTCRYSGGVWYAWDALDGRTFAPDAGLAVTSRTPGTMDVFAVADGSVHVRQFTDGSWEPAWRPLSEARAEVDRRSRLAATTTRPDQIELFVSDKQGFVQQFTLDPTGRVLASDTLPPLNHARALAAEPLEGPDVQVHAVTEGPDDARLWSIEGHLDAWPPWQINRLPPERKPGEDAGVAAAKERPGSAIALVGGATPLARFFESGSWKSDTETVDGVKATKLSSIAAAALSPETLIAFTIGEGRDERAGLPTIYKATRSFDPELVNADAQAKREYVGTLVTLDGRMVTVNDDDAFPLPSALKTTQGQQFIGPHERFTVVELKDINDGNGVKCLAAFRAHNGQFVSADRGGDSFLAANRSQRGPWETFILYDMADPGRHSWISTLTGRMWSVEPGGNEFLIANRSLAGEWETFFLVGKPRKPPHL